MSHESVTSLYVAGLSASKIATKLGISQWAVYRELKNQKINRRSAAESNALTFGATPQSFSLRNKLNYTQRQLWISGLLLYLGEGSKKSDKTVDLANCDERVLKIFLKMLREIYCVDESRIRIYIYCHDNKDPREIINYWSSLLVVPESQFTKPYIKSGSKGLVSGKMENGLVHIRYSDKRLWHRLMNDLHILIDKLLG